MKKYALSVVVVLTIAAIPLSVVMAQSTGDVEAITQLENDSVKADLANDASFYENLMADDYTKVTSRGTWLTKASYLAAKKRPDPNVKLINLQLSDLRVRVVCRDVAIATYRLDIERTTQGQRSVIYTDVFQKRSGAWKLIASHVSRVEK